MDFKKKILITSYRDDNGAGKSALKLHSFFLENRINSKFLSFHKTSSADSIFEYPKSKSTFFKYNLNKFLNKSLNLNSNIYYKSFTFFDYDVSSFINSLNVDLVQLNWINFFLNINDINRINRPLVWRLSDIWALKGIRHFDNVTDNSISDKIDEFIDYSFDFFKYKNFNKQIFFVSPTQWIANRISSHKIFKNSHVEVIPTPIDNQIFNIDSSIPKIPNSLLFSSVGGVEDKRKGFNYLLSSLKILSSKKIFLDIFIIGGNKKKIESFYGHNLNFIGHVNAQEIISYYNKVVATVIPSTADNLPQVGLESQMCGTPVITFNKEGLKELISPKFGKYLAKYQDVVSLSRIIINLLRDNIDNQDVRRSILKINNKKLILKKYLNLYNLANKDFHYKSSIISSTDNLGGAAKATYKTFIALEKHSKIKTDMNVIIKSLNNNFIFQQTGLLKQYNYLCYKFGSFYNRIFRFFGKNFYTSLNISPSFHHNYLNKNNYSLIDIHWIGNETFSFYDLSKISSPLIITLHDQWLLRGVNHYNLSNSNSKFYYPFFFKNFIKKKKDELFFISPSKWLIDDLKKNNLLKNFSCFHIPYSIDHQVFKKYDKKYARSQLSIKTNKRIILFGALGADIDKRKGLFILKNILNNIKNKNDFVIVTFGSQTPIKFNEFQVINLGMLSNLKKMVMAYNSADVMVVPSIIDNLPQTALEAQTCGLPVVTFDSYGMKETIDNNKTGYAVKQYDLENFAKCIEKITKNKINNIIRYRSRERAISLWSPKVIANQLESIYLKIIKRRNLM